jgi:hypothetical protein
MIWLAASALVLSKPAIAHFASVVGMHGREACCMARVFVRLTLPSHCCTRTFVLLTPVDASAVPLIAAPGWLLAATALLLQDGEPQAIDALASCYDDTSRPPVLSYKHIQERLCSSSSSSSSYAQHSGQQQAAAEGEAGSSGPYMLGGTGSSGASSGGWSAQEGSSSGSGQQSSSGPGGETAGSALLAPYQQQQQQRLAGADSWSLLFDGLEQQQPAVTVSDTLLDFGCCSRLSPSEPQSFQVCAHSCCLPSLTLHGIVTCSCSCPLLHLRDLAEHLSAAVDACCPPYHAVACR